MKQITHVVCWILFVAAIILAAIAVFEKLVNLWGFTVLRASDPWHVLELSAVALLFVIALQMRDLKTFLSARDSK